MDELFRYLGNDLTAVIIVVVAALFLIPWSRRDLRWSRRGLRLRVSAVAATVSAALALLINQPIAHAVDRARPYVAHPHAAHLLISRSHDPSFPSDHATGAFAIAVAIWFYDRVVGGILLALAGLLAFARVYVGTHYPSDVLAGAAIGTLVALALRWRPIRAQLERVAFACSALWEQMLSHARRAPALKR